jgi:hypothetical protein
MRKPNFPYRPASAIKDLPAICMHSNGLAEPTFLGADYVCTELPTHVTPARTKEQQALLDEAYEGWEQDV